MSTTPLVSVVIAAYNAEDYIADAVASVLNQTMDDLELIVVDDGSTDTTREVLRRFEGDPRMRVVEQNNAGCSAARNRGAAAATGNYIAIVDADDVCWPHKLEYQIDCFRQRPQLAVVGTHARMIGPRGQHLGVVRTPPDHGTIAEGMQHSMQFCHATILIRADVFERLGGYDESYPTSEDYQFLRRVVTRHRAANVDRILYDMRIHADSKSFYYFEQQRLRGLLTRHLMDSDTSLDDGAHRRFDGRLSRDQLVAEGIDPDRIDRQMVTNFVHRVQMLDRLGRRDRADDFLSRARAYARRHDLGEWADTELRALQSLRALSNGHWRRWLNDTASVATTSPGLLIRRYYESGRYTLHRWVTKREFDGADAPPPRSEIKGDEEITGIRR